MLVLDATTKKIQAKLASAPTTSNLEVATAYADITTTSFTPANNLTTISGNTDTDIISAPGASTQRQIKYISVYNCDTETHSLTIKIDNSGTDYRIWNGTLASGERLEFVDGIGFRTFDAQGNQRMQTAFVFPHPNPRPGVGIDAANLTAVKTLTNSSTFAYYMGRADEAFTNIVLRFRVTTAAATITYAEVAIASSPLLTIAGNTSLTRRGYTDTSAIVNSTGQKSVNVSVDGITVGMHLWALFSSNATTAQIVRGALADDLQSGFFQAATSTRPSTMSGGTNFTVEGATTVPVWFTWQGT